MTHLLICFRKQAEAEEQRKWLRVKLLTDADLKAANGVVDFSKASVEIKLARTATVSQFVSAVQQPSETQIAQFVRGEPLGEPFCALCL